MERIEGSVSQFSDFTKNFFHYGGCVCVNVLLTYMYRKNQGGSHENRRTI